MDLSGTLYIDGRAGTSAASIEIGMGRTNSDYAYIDLIGDTTYTDYGLRLIRENTGANAVGRLENFGTGGLQLQTNHAAPIAFLTDAGTERMRIAADGKVGVGTSAPNATMEVIGDAQYNVGSGGFRASTSSGATANTMWMQASSVDDAATIQSYKIGTGAGVKPLLLNPSGGNVGIGTAAPATALDVVTAASTGIRTRSTNSGAISALSLSNPTQHYTIMLRGDSG